MSNKSGKPDLSPAYLEQMSREQGRLSVEAAQDALKGVAKSAVLTPLTGPPSAVGLLAESALDIIRTIGHADAAEELQKQADISRMCKDPNDMMERFNATASMNRWSIE